jgi:hypothetical protein
VYCCSFVIDKVFLKLDSRPYGDDSGGERWRVATCCLALFRDIISSYKIVFPPPAEASQ